MIIGGLVLIGCGSLFFVVYQNFSPWSEQRRVRTDQHVTVVYPNDIQTLSPLATSLVERSTVLNLYDSLVAYDQNLTIRPALAISYGRLDDTHWEFVLRENAYFFNGKKVNADDVVASFSAYQKDSPDSFFLQNIQHVEKVDDRTIHITTTRPDVLLLSKVSRVLIFPQGSSPETLSVQPMGTGPYRLQSWEKGEQMVLVRNDQYWGDPAVIKTIQIVFTKNEEESLSYLNRHTTDLVIDGNVLWNIPASYHVQIEPLLQNTFLLFNIHNPLLSDKEFRKTIVDILSQHKQEYIHQYGEKNMVSSSQFVSNWVIGYKPDMGEDTTASVPQGMETATFSLSYDPADDTLAQWIQNTLKPYGITLTLHAVSLDTPVSSDTISSDLSLRHWYFAYGDAGEFFDQVVHSFRPSQGLGLLNVMQFSSSVLDQLIESSDQNSNPVQRLKALQDINYTITKKEIIGVPLFEIRKIYIMDKKLQFRPRLDGNILFHDLRWL
jgi:peptide/nickel transport system substrate-binding protein